jgi:hypothetical protein
MAFIAAIFRNPAIQLAQEGAAVMVVIFPGVLAIQNDGHQRIAARAQDARAVFADAAQKIVGGGRGVHLRINEADQVAHEMVAEQHAHGSAALPPLVRPIEPVDRDRLAEGPVEHAAIGGSPFETQLRGDGEDLVGDRAFRRPQSHRLGAERFAAIFARHG